MDPENITFRPVTVCNMIIGEGLPKICIPLTGDTPDKLMQELLSVLPEKPDMLEWRADFYKPLWNDLNKTGGAAIDEADTRFAIEFRYALKNAIETIFRVCAPQIPVLFTVRTDSEGGHLFIYEEAYKDAMMLASEVLSEYDNMKLVDIEMKRAFAPAIINKAHSKGLYVVASYHDFDKTPPTAEIAGILANGAKLKGDISKIAVMPREQSDVSRLLNGARRASQALEIPIIAISMGELGRMSRISGHHFGSSVTFAKGVNASAPGQIDAKMLRRIMR